MYIVETIRTVYSILITKERAKSLMRIVQVQSALPVPPIIQLPVRVVLVNASHMSTAFGPNASIIT